MADDSERVDTPALIVFDYETYMFESLWLMLKDGCSDEFRELSKPVRNAVVQSTLLHIRILVDILLSRGKRDDDIQLGDVIPNYQSETLEKLRQAYGNGSTPGHHCWTLNKMMAHPTKRRLSSYEYTQVFDDLCPLIIEIIKEIAEQQPELAKMKSMPE